MIKTKSIIFLFVLSISWLGKSQSNEGNDLSNPKWPSENIYLHINTNNAFAGETLFYKVYVSTEDNSLSKYSKVAYVNLISPKKAVVVKQKVMLHDGQGNADFFIPTNLPTGNYKLIAYTKLGLRQSSNNMFSTDISIINPYIPLNADLVSVVEKPIINNISSKPVIETNINMELSKAVYSNREKIEVNLLLKDKSDYGHYSISVKKIDSFQFQKPTTILRHNDYQETIKVNNPSSFLPEIRGDLISGSISSSAENVPLDNQGIALLIPEKDFILKLGRTDKDGRFFFNIDKSYASKTAVLQVINELNGSYRFQVDKEPRLDLSTLSIEKLEIYKDLQKQIIEKSISNQIENNYSSVKRNFPKSINQPAFFGNRGENYNLDDYTRFPSLNETFIEIVKGVAFKKNEDSYEILVRASDYNFQSPFKALVLVDGLMVQDHSVLYDFNAKDVQHISVIKDKYFFGGNIFQGVLSIQTKTKNNQNLMTQLNLESFDLFSPEIEKNYHNVMYDGTKELEHIPDFRSQLFWEPNLKLSSPNTPISFFSSDETGFFEIVVEGISEEGERFRATSIFEVK